MLTSLEGIRGQIQTLIDCSSKQQSYLFELEQRILDMQEDRMIYEAGVYPEELDMDTDLEEEIMMVPLNSPKTLVDIKTVTAKTNSPLSKRVSIS